MKLTDCTLRNRSLSASASSHHDLSLAGFITNIAESDFRYTQGSPIFTSDFFGETPSKLRKAPEKAPEKGKETSSTEQPQA
jgi:hypothetical protein